MNGNLLARLAPALFVAAAAATVASPRALAAVGKTIDVPGFEAITSSEEARGDAPAFLKLLARIIERNPSSDAAALALIRIPEVKPEVADAASILRPALEKALARGMPGVRSRDRALAILAALDAEAGDWDRARTTFARRGFIRDWLVVGAFGFTRRAVHDRPFPVEVAQRAENLDVNEAFQGWAGRAAWRAATVGPLGDGFIPGDYFDPDDGCGYALAQVRAPAGTRSVLTIVCRGSFKAWWNGALVADFDRAADYRPDRAEIAITFGEGWNRLLVKDTSARNEVAASLVAADGSGPVRGLEVASERIEPLGPGGGTAEAIPLRETPSSPGAFAMAARAVLLADAGLRPIAMPLFQGAASGEPKAPHLAWLCARAFEEAEHLPAPRRMNEARAHVTATLERDPRFVPALERRARFPDEDGRPEAALQALRAVAKEHPDYSPALRSQIAIARRQGWECEMLEAIHAFERIRPKSPNPKLLLAEHYQRKDNGDRALELHRAALEIDRSLVWVEERIASAALQRGDAATAEAIWKALVERYPGEPSRLRGLAEVRRSEGRTGEAAELLARAANLRSPTPDDWEHLGEILLEGGRKAEAVANFERALAAAPGRYHLRRLLAKLGGAKLPRERVEDRADFEREFDVDIVADLKNAPGAEKYPKAHSICILDQTVTRIYRDGSRVDYVHQAFKLLDDAGVQRHHTEELPGKILELRTIGVDGKTYEPIITDSTSKILMPKLEPGAVIDFRYRSPHGRPRFQFDSGTFYFKDPEHGEPLDRSVYTVIADKAFDFEPIERNLPVKPKVEDRGDTVVYTWDVRSSDRVDPEPFMPDRDEILPSVRLVSRRTWDDVSELYRENFIGRTRLTPELRAKAMELLESVASPKGELLRKQERVGSVASPEGELLAGPLATDLEKARRLYDFALDHVRSDGGGGDAAQVFSERSGSRTVLLKALLDAAGVPSRFGLAAENPRVARVEVWDPPRPDLLSNPVLVIEPRGADPVWVIEGGRFYPFGLLPVELQGATAMLLGRHGGELCVVPEAPLESSARVEHTSLRVEGRGAVVDGSMRLLAASGYRLKDQVATASRAQLKRFVEGRVGRTYRGAEVDTFDFPEASKPGEPFSLTYRARVTEQVQVRNGRPSIELCLEALELTRTFGGKSKREQPIVIRRHELQRETVEIDLGGEYDVESLPSNLLLNDRFGLYSLTFATDGSRIRIQRTFALLPARLEAAEYGSVLRFAREVDSAERKWIDLRKKKRE